MATSDVDTNKFTNSFWKRPFLAVLGTIVIGAVGSGLWDVGIKPGIGWLSTSVFYIATLGSESLRDYTYANAAMDPTVEPSLRVYSALTGFMVAICSILILSEFGITKRLRSPFLMSSNLDQLPDESVEELEQLLVEYRAANDRFRKLRRILVTLLGLSIGFILGSSIITNQSVLIWRSFRADMKICAPYLSSEEEEMLNSQYSLMESKTDFMAILDKLSDAVKSEKLQLHSLKLR